MKLHQLRALVAVARSGSIHEAARNLHLTQPAVTRALRDLESDVGMMLVVRSSSGVLLTQEGRLLLRRAELIVHEMARAENELEQSRDARQGRVSIGLTPLAAFTVMPVAYREFRKRMPDVVLEFGEFPPTQLLDQLRNGSLDFALGTAADSRNFLGIQCQHLATFPVWFAVNRDGELAKDPTLEKLLHAEWLHTGPSDEFKALLTELFDREGLPVPRRITRCASQSLFYSLSLNSNVVTSWTDLTLHATDVFHHLQALPLKVQPPPRNLYLLFRDSGILTSAAEHFVSCVQSAVREAGTGRCATRHPA